MSKDKEISFSLVGTNEQLQVMSMLAQAVEWGVQFKSQPKPQ